MSPRQFLCGVSIIAALAIALAAEPGRPSNPPIVSTALTVKGRATLRGRVRIEGRKPDIAEWNLAFQTARRRGPDAAVCLKSPIEENEQQTWRIDDEGGVANVVVWLRPADDSHFVMETEDLHPRTRTWAKEVVIDQRHLNFSPHTVALFPSYFDPVKKKQVPTGQVLRVINSAPVACNVNASGGKENPGDNVILPPLTGDRVFEFHPDRKPVVLHDSIHNWMTAYAWVFDHPYATVTDREGRYEIRKVPAGRVLRLMVWHEDVGYLYGRDGILVELKDGDNRKNLSLHADN